MTAPRGAVNEKYLGRVGRVGLLDIVRLAARALLEAEWVEMNGGSRCCPCCPVELHAPTSSVTGHRNACALDDALSAMGFETQEQRDAARAAMRGT